MISFKIVGKKPRGWPKKRWIDGVKKQDLENLRY